MGGDSLELILLACGDGALPSPSAALAAVAGLRAGMALPLAAHVLGRILPQRAAMLASNATVLTDGLLLRYCVIAAAQYTPMI